MDINNMPDYLLTVEQLDEKYNPDGDGEHPHYTREWWRRVVSMGSTLRGYWDWVADAIEQDEENQK